jgi:hypothetical protein
LGLNAASAGGWRDWPRPLGNGRGAPVVTEAGAGAGAGGR